MTSTFRQIPDDVDVKLAPISLNEMLLIALRDGTPADSLSKHNLQAGRLRDLAEASLRPRLLTVAGVSGVVVAGGLRKQYQVILSIEKLAASDITPSELATALRGATTAVGELPVRANASLDGLAGTVIKASAARVPVRLKDVAEVRIGWISDTRPRITRSKQREATEDQAVIVAVQLEPDADKATVGKEVNAVVLQMKQQLPQGITIGRTVDQRFDSLVHDLAGKLQQDLPPGVQLERRSTEQSGDELVIPPRQRIVVKLYGPDLAFLRRRADGVRRRMQEVAGVVNLREQLLQDEPQLYLEIDRDLAARLGVTSRQVADAFGIAMGDHVVSRIREGDREYDLVMKSCRAEEAGHIPVRTESGALVPIEQVTRIMIKTAPSAIYRENGRRVNLISCEAKDRKPAEIAADITNSIGPLPSGYFIETSY